jgi:hypothetical protein
MVELYLHSLIQFQGVVLNYLSTGRILPLPVLVFILICLNFSYDVFFQCFLVIGFHAI